MSNGQESDVLLRERHGAVVLLTLNRPQRRNALSRALRNALRQAFLDVAADESVRALVITGSDPAFCAGLDLGELIEASPQVEEGDMMDALHSLDIPAVAAINGAAVTGGLELALGCDVMIASEWARFADTHGRVGVHPGWGMTVELPRLVGAGRARLMSLTGNYVDAPTAERWGLVARVVPHEKVVAEALEVAASIAELDPQIARALRRLYRDGGGADAARVAERESFAAWQRARPRDAVAADTVRAVIERGRAQQPGDARRAGTEQP
jgi:enoyl-CoA hydratase